MIEKTMPGVDSAVPARLGTEERLALVDAIAVLDRVGTSAQFIACMDREIQRIFPHEMMVCGIANIEGDNVRPYCTLLNHFPQAYMESLRTPDGGMNSALLERWQETRKPVLVELEYDVEGWPETWVANANKYKLRNFAQMGFIDIQGTTGSSFVFSRIPGRLGDRHAYLLRLLVPHLHMALLRSMTPIIECAMEDFSRNASPLKFTRRQREVLHWLCVGKTNWEIARILGTSEDTIKYHVSQVFAKLKVSSRAHAVAMAHDMKSIER